MKSKEVLKYIPMPNAFPGPDANIRHVANHKTGRLKNVGDQFNNEKDNKQQDGFSHAYQFSVSFNLR